MEFNATSDMPPSGNSSTAKGLGFALMNSDNAVLLLHSAARMVELFIEVIIRALMRWCTTEMVACGVVAAGGLWFLQKVVMRKPKATIFVACVWCLWLVLDLLVGRGATECAEDMLRRSNEAFNESRELAKILVRFTSAWLHFLMPFLSDAATWASFVWAKLTLQQRLLLLAAGLTIYAVIETIRAVRTHTGMIKKVFFQAAFLPIGPMLWEASGLVPQIYLPNLLIAFLTVLPALMSLQTIRSTLSHHTEGPPSMGRKMSRLASVPLNAEERRTMWLSYWACWPFLVVLELSIQWLPWLVPGYKKAGLPPQSELRRVLLVLALWLQFWQGSRILNFTIRSLLGRFSAGVVNIPIKAVIRKTKEATGQGDGVQASMRSLSLLGKVGRASAWIASHKRLWKLIAVLALIGFSIIAWMFYRTIRLFSDVLTGLTWAFAAADTADTLFKGAESFYDKRLAFWIMAMAWNGITKVPAVGGALSIFTPMVFSLLYLAGDQAMSWILLPVIASLETIVGRKTSAAKTASSPQRSRTSSSTRGDQGEDENGSAVRKDSESTLRRTSSGLRSTSASPAKGKK